MRKFILQLVFSFSQCMLSAQSFSNPALNALVQAEYDFIADSKKYGSQKAFYNHLADNAITFGETIRKGRKNFEGKSDTTNWLNWKPVFTDIASSGDFGYNTGPWEFWNKRSDEKPVAFGEFVTVWYKQPSGNWRAIIDIGIAHNLGMRDERISTSKIPLKKSKGNQQNTLLNTERNFIEQKNYADVISKEARFYRGNHLPVTKDEIPTILQEQGELKYSVIDGKVAYSNDLGYVYGTVIASGEKPTHYYLRIWKKENGNHWKIVLDLLTPLP